MCGCDNLSDGAEVIMRNKQFKQRVNDTILKISNVSKSFGKKVVLKDCSLDIRRAKLYYLRDLKGKAARIREKLESKQNAAE